MVPKYFTLQISILFSFKHIAKVYRLCTRCLSLNEDGTENARRQFLLESGDVETIGHQRAQHICQQETENHFNEKQFMLLSVLLMQLRFKLNVLTDRY